MELTIILSQSLHQPMEEEEEDYFAPFGMSQFDFNSMIRRRNLANLTQQLVEQGRVTLPGASAVASSDRVQLADVKGGGAHAPESPATYDEDVARRSSSIYSREIDEDSPRSATFFDGPCRQPVVSEGHSPTLMHMLSRNSSMCASVHNSSPATTSTRTTSVDTYCSATAAPKAGSCPLESDPSFYESPRSSDTKPRSLSSSPPVTSSRATSLDTHCSGTAAPQAEYCPPLPLQSAVKDTLRTSIPELHSLYSSSFPATSWRSASVDTYCSGTAAPKAQYCPVKTESWFYKTPRMSDNESHSSPAATSIVDRVRASNPMPRQQKNAGGSELEASKERDLDLLKSIIALLRRSARQEELQELQPPVDRIVELSRLRRTIRKLDFDFDDAIMLASDLTSLVPVPPLPSSQETPETNDVGDILETRKWFRSRLAKTVRRRIAVLRNELRVGDALKIEHWYKDVVDLVGWRDEDEARMMWSWLVNDGFF